MKYLIKRILSTCAWKKTNQNLASDIIFKLFHIYSLLGIINEKVCNRFGGVTCIVYTIVLILFSSIMC